MSSEFASEEAEILIRVSRTPRRRYLERRLKILRGTRKCDGARRRRRDARRKARSSAEHFLAETVIESSRGSTTKASQRQRAKEPPRGYTCARAVNFSVKRRDSPRGLRKPRDAYARDSCVSAGPVARTSHLESLSGDGNHEASPARLRFNINCPGR